MRWRSWGYARRRRPRAPGGDVSQLLDEDRRATIVGVLLRGTKREEVERGQVLCKPGSINPAHEVWAEVYVLTKEEGGRHNAFFRGIGRVLLSHHGRDGGGGAAGGHGEW